MPFTVLSTKKLSPVEQSIFTGGRIFCEPFIAVSFPEFTLPKCHPIDAVFTSQNAVKALFLKGDFDPCFFRNVFCVGEKTATYLAQFGIPCIEVASSSYELSQLIADYDIKSIHYFVGDLGLVQPMEALQKCGISVIKHIVYHTKILQKRLVQNFDAVLFFSPSAIKGYVESGNALNVVAFCIGHTTAKEAERFFQKVIISKQQSVESVLKAVDDFLRVR